MALSQGWILKQLDVSDALLHGDLQERVYLTQPPGFEDSTRPNYVCQLHKALYRLKQAPQARYMKFSTYIQQLGFHCCPYDTSLFFRRQGNEVLMLLIYLDVIILIGSSTDQIQKFLAHLFSVFHMKDLGDLHYFLGIQVA